MFSREALVQNKEMLFDDISESDDSDEDTKLVLYASARTEISIKDPQYEICLSEVKEYISIENIKVQQNLTEEEYFNFKNVIEKFKHLFVDRASKLPEILNGEYSIRLIEGATSTKSYMRCY
ncbi:hypothetical protein BB561_003429 [Smittium simulii]|uniref:Uncharacterized protein n=1 Tax=Smittium simulii TaxID=133385 RepID=A0A2T9YLF6_9FUNG|nr:hypothetical protein BB561_003429 [Smittium simulii]